MRSREPNGQSTEASTRLIEVRGINPWETRKAVYEIALRSGESVFMRIDGTNYRNTERMVVLVDAQRFLLHWRADRDGLHVNEANGNPGTWVCDYKFDLAATGFAHGADNPVPLAEIGCWLKPDVHLPVARFLARRARLPSTSPVVTFTNGVTRTLWLLTHGAASFPVECSRNESELLSHCCGIPGMAPKSVFEITHAMDRSD